MIMIIPYKNTVKQVSFCGELTLYRSSKHYQCVCILNVALYVFNSYKSLTVHLHNLFYSSDSSGSFHLLFSSGSLHLCVSEAAAE